MNINTMYNALTVGEVLINLATYTPISGKLSSYFLRGPLATAEVVAGAALLVLGALSPVVAPASTPYLFHGSVLLAHGALNFVRLKIETKGLPSVFACLPNGFTCLPYDVVSLVVLRGRLFPYPS
jgi:hypothetical protein